MAYSVLASSKTPALIIYLVDVSLSMNQPFHGRRRIDVVHDALTAAIQKMVFRSTKGARIAPRYRTAIYAYSDEVYDVLDGVRSVDQVAAAGIPELYAFRTTDTAKAFAKAEQLLRRELPNLQGCPAPLVCHLTDGEYTGADPEPIVRRIMAMAVPDGRVLVENIFLSDRVLTTAVHDLSQWPGITPSTNLADDYASKLRAISSPLPESYRATMVEHGVYLSRDAVMLLPGANPELIELGFQMSAATPVR